MPAARSHGEPLSFDRPGLFGRPTPAGQLVPRRPTTLRGRLEGLRPLTGPGGARLEAELSGPTGSVVLVFLGPRRTPALVPGTVLEARRTPRAHAGRTEIVNPLNELLAPPGEAGPIRSRRHLRSEP